MVMGENGATVKTGEKKCTQQEYNITPLVAGLCRICTTSEGGRHFHFDSQAPNDPFTGIQSRLFTGGTRRWKQAKHSRELIFDWYALKSGEKPSDTSVFSTRVARDKKVEGGA